MRFSLRVGGGGIALILAFFSFQTLPVNTAGILLILLSIIFFILEIKVVSYGLLSIAGVVSMLLGSLMLFEGEGYQSQLSWHVLIPTLLIVSAFFVHLGKPGLQSPDGASANRGRRPG